MQEDSGPAVEDESEIVCGEDGHCLFAEEELTEEEAAAIADLDPLPWEEYGLEGCTEVALGMCDLDGVLHCHDTITGWAECPGQPSGDTCEHTENDALSFTGSTQRTGSQPTVTLAAGTWAVSVCLWDNTVLTAQPAPFTANLLEVPEEGRQRQIWIPLVDEQSVASGQWTNNEVLPAQIYDELDADEFIFEIAATPEGGGSWVIRFTLVP